MPAHSHISPEGFSTTSFLALTYIFTIVFGTACVLAIGLRLWARRVAGRRVDLSDWLLIASGFFTVLIWIMSCVVLVQSGYRTPNYVPPVRTIKGLVAYNKVTFVITLFWVWATYLCKLSILRLYSLVLGRRFQASKHKFMPNIVQGVAYLTGACGIGTFLGYLCVLRPIALWWGGEDGRLQPEYSDVIAMNSFNLYFVYLATIVTDVTILVLPLWPIYKMQTDRKRKIALMIAFTCGFGTCALSVVRLIFGAVIMETTNWDGLETFVFQAAEPTFGILAACVPTLSPLLFSKPNKSSQQYQYPTSTFNSQAPLCRSNGTYGSGGRNGSDASQFTYGRGSPRQCYTPDEYDLKDFEAQQVKRATFGSSGASRVKHDSITAFETCEDWRLEEGKNAARF